MTDAALRNRAQALKFRLQEQGLDEAVVFETFALVRELARRVLGKRHFDVQVWAAWVLLYGNAAEMNTGEGKTLTATLAAATAALAGIPTHVVTVNDYLVERDASDLGPLYEALGLSVGTILEGMTPHERRVAYACDVTYCSNKELVSARVARPSAHRRRGPHPRGGLSSRGYQRRRLLEGSPSASIGTRARPGCSSSLASTTMGRCAAATPRARPGCSSSASTTGRIARTA